MTTSGSSLILAVDVGTSALKAVLYQADGRLLQVASQGYGYRSPQPGWAEADPEAWWRALEGALAQLQAEGFPLGQVAALGVTGQMHTPVLLDRAGQVIPPTILWLDRRAQAEAQELRERLGLPPFRLSGAHSLPKLLWLARHRPQVMARVRSLLWPKDYLRFRLTGRRLTDLTDADGSGLLDRTRRAWSLERLALVGLDPEVLPPLAPPQEDAGPLLPGVAKALGLPPSARVIVGAGDVLALLGGAPPAPERLNCSLGSSAMLATPLTEEESLPPQEQRMHVYELPPYRLLNAVLSTSGRALTWAWQGLFSAETPLSQVLEMAQGTRPGSDGLIFLPFLAGERSPYWNDGLRGGFYGLTLAHSRAHMVRAVLEGVAYSLRHLLEIAQELAHPIQELALSGGGAEVAGWPNIIAQVCQRPVRIHAGKECVTRPLFAYCRTVLEPGLSFQEALLATFQEPPQEFLPDPALAGIYDPLYRRYRAWAEVVAGWEGTSPNF